MSPASRSRGAATPTLGGLVDPAVGRREFFPGRWTTECCREFVEVCLSLGAELLATKRGTNRVLAEFRDWQSLRFHDFVEVVGEVDLDARYADSIRLSGADFLRTL